mgnify:FL=1
MLLGTIGAGISILISRSIFRILNLKSFQWSEQVYKRFLIIGSVDECIRVYKLLQQTEIKTSFIGFIHIEETQDHHEMYVGLLDQLEEAVGVYDIDELIFCSKNLSAQEIISQMSIINLHDLDFKIAPEESMYVIGSNSINTQGELYAFELNSINKLENIRNKRIFDIISSMILLLFFPVLIVVSKSFLGLLRNILSVLFGLKSWVSYQKSNENDALPKIKAGILNPVSHLRSEYSELTVFKLNMLYAKEYRLKNDFDILLKNLNRIG